MEDADGAVAPGFRFCSIHCCFDAASIDFHEE